MSTITLSDMFDRMPLLAEMRPDFLPEKLQSILLLASIKIAERARILERTYEFDLQCCTGEYLLDESEERVIKITQICHFNHDIGLSDCGLSGREPFSMDNQKWCAIPSCDGSRARFVPSRNILEISPVSGLRGWLRVTATVAPNYDACEIDETFSTMYRNAVFHESAGAALRYPGEFNSAALASHHEKLAEQEIGRIVTNMHTGYKNTTKVVKNGRRFI
jgi:hypothetical protein